jgi:hypothetical protein
MCSRWVWTGPLFSLTPRSLHNRFRSRFLLIRIKVAWMTSLNAKARWFQYIRIGNSTDRSSRCVSNLFISSSSWPPTWPQSSRWRLYRVKTHRFLTLLRVRQQIPWCHGPYNKRKCCQQVLWVKRWGQLWQLKREGRYSHLLCTATGTSLDAAAVQRSRVAGLPENFYYPDNRRRVW